MKKVLISFLEFNVFLSVFIFFSISNAAGYQKTQWEYLIVSYGKTKFTDIATSVRTGSSKLSAFHEFSTLLDGMEAVSTQKQIDILGRLGWELAEIVGSIGGDQQFVFKRIRDKNRSKVEKKFALELKGILEEEEQQRELILEALNKELSLMRKKQNELESKKLIDIDSVERKKREKEAYSNAKKGLIESMSKFGVKKNDTFEDAIIKHIDFEGECHEVTYGSSKGTLSGEMRIIIVLDASSTLIKNRNQYRASEAEKLAISVIEKIRRAIENLGMKKLSFGGNLSASVTIKLKNKVGEIQAGRSSFHSDYKVVF